MVKEFLKIGRRKKMMKIKRPSKTTNFLDIALVVSKRSSCLKRHYGCIIVKDDRIVSTGYNGSARGAINCCDAGKCNRENVERYTGYENCPAVHAEQNAIISANPNDLIGATVYLACETFSDGTAGEDKNPEPCPICLNMLKNAKVGKIINRGGVVYVCD